MDRIVRQVSLALVISMGIVYCEPPLSSQYGVPGNYAGNNNNQGSSSGGNGFGNHHYDNGNDNDYVDQPMSYEFGYAVKDQATGNDFGRRETSDGETVRGEYRVQLPDGRTQIVTYTADWRTGFHADVRYEGTATYPDQYNTQNNANNNPTDQRFGLQGNNIAAGYNGGRGNNNGGYNYQSPNGNYNNGNNNYQFGSNSLDNNYNNFGARNGYNTQVPSTMYGPAFH